MLRAKSKEVSDKQGRWTCRVLVGVVAAVGVGLAVLPNPGPKAHAAATSTAATTSAGAAEPEPFELSYLPSDCHCVLAMRPAAVLRRPALAGYAALINLGLRGIPSELGLKGTVRLSAQDVEQVITRGSFGLDPKNKEHPHNATFGLHTVRCVGAFDWKGQMKEFFPQAEEIHHAGGVYYRQPKSEKTHGKLSGVCYYIPDSRTMVMDGEDNLRKLMENKGKKAPAAPWLEDWRKVDRGLLALALDPRACNFKDAVNVKDAVERGLLPLLDNASWLTLGVSGEEDMHIRAFAVCPGETAAGKVLAAATALLEHGRKAANAPTQDSHGKDKSAALSEALAKQLLQTAVLERKQTRVEFHCEARGGFNELLQSTFDLQGPNAEAKPATSKP
jgi:hypothetical protein